MCNLLTIFGIISPFFGILVVINIFYSLYDLVNMFYLGHFVVCATSKVAKICKKREK